MAHAAIRLFAAAMLAMGAFTPTGCTAQTATKAGDQRDTGEHWTWGTSPEITESSAVIAAVKIAYFRQDFAGLDALDAEYRGSRGSLPSGESKLALYYWELAHELEQIGSSNPADACDIGWKPFLDKWQAASPRSPAVVVLRASLLQTKAWCYRGDNTANRVASDAWQPFQDNIGAATTLLEKNKAIASVDPQYYAELLSLSLVKGGSREDFEHILEEASTRFPYYYEIYYAAYRYYQPQWYGSVVQIDQFARHVAETTKARDGTSGYFRLYFHMALCRCFRDMEAMDWPTMKIAMADLADRYPIDWVYLRLAQMSCVRGKGEEAITYLAKVSVNDAQAWTRKDWDQCRSLIGPSKLPFPQ